MEQVADPTILRGEIESGFHLSKIYYRHEMCSKYVRILKEMGNL
nr:hypothetical protein [uncultured Blautia sp.]